jgi:hypothetical protein
MQAGRFLTSPGRNDQSQFLTDQYLENYKQLNFKVVGHFNGSNKCLRDKQFFLRSSQMKNFRTSLWQLQKEKNLRVKKFHSP